jgi:phage replication-related protein YjqB (UPF0714/DUF867 family)
MVEQVPTIGLLVPTTATRGNRQPAISSVGSGRSGPRWEAGPVGRPTFAELLATRGVTEEAEIRGPVGFMAYHGGGLEEMTDVIAREAADRSGASYYGVVHPPDWTLHLPSTRIDPTASRRLGDFLDHVEEVITVHGFGRRALLTSLLLGGRNRDLAGHVARHLRDRLPAYDVVDDLDRIPSELRGVHERNPVNLPRGGGVQIELPPRVRGSSPLWWDWEHGLVPHTVALIDGLAEAARTRLERRAATPRADRSDDETTAGRRREEGALETDMVDGLTG